MSGKDRQQFEKQFAQRCEAMKASGREFSEDSLRREHGRAWEKSDQQLADVRQRSKFTRNKRESKPKGTITTVITADGSVEHLDRDVSPAEAFGETGVSNISRKKDKAYDP